MSVRLVEYSSDEDPSSEEFDLTENSSKDRVKGTLTTEPLPLPSEIQEMYNEKVQDNYTEDTSKHGGKIRTFPHERGVWATHVFIEYVPSAEFSEMLKELQRVMKDHSIFVEPHDTFHISLSKTVKLRHHFIAPFVESLNICLKTFYRFQLKFESIEVYENEEKTRTFLGLKVHHGMEPLTKLVKKVDLCLADFQLPNFYKDPSFHLSFASCVGSKSQIIETFLADLNIVFQLFVENDPCFRTLWVSKINCRSGNKLFTTTLKT